MATYEITFETADLSEFDAAGTDSDTCAGGSSARSIHTAANHAITARRL